MATDFKAMIGRFGVPVSIIRRTGSYSSSGVWTPGAPTTIPAVASIQPARGENLAFLPDGQRTGDVMVAYVDTEVFPSSSGGARQEDHLVWKGQQYKILSVRPWEMTQVFWEAMIVRSTQV